MLGIGAPEPFVARLQETADVAAPAAYALNASHIISTEPRLRCHVRLCAVGACPMSSLPVRVELAPMSRCSLFRTQAGESVRCEFVHVASYRR